PYRVLVVADFPANFSPESARRLLSLATSGARCGIYTLISVDTRQPMPHGFTLGDLEQACVKLVSGGVVSGRVGNEKAAASDRTADPLTTHHSPLPPFSWTDPDFGTFPLKVDTPPDAGFSTRVMHGVGELAKLASRVEVPFEFVAPPPERWW